MSHLRTVSACAIVRDSYIHLRAYFLAITAQKIKIPIKDFFSKCDQIRRKLRIW